MTDRLYPSQQNWQHGSYYFVSLNCRHRLQTPLLQRARLLGSSQIHPPFGEPLCDCGIQHHAQLCCQGNPQGTHHHSHWDCCSKPRIPVSSRWLSVAWLSIGEAEGTCSCPTSLTPGLRQRGGWVFSWVCARGATQWRRQREGHSLLVVTPHHWKCTKPTPWRR